MPWKWFLLHCEQIRINRKSGRMMWGICIPSVHHATDLNEIRIISNQFIAVALLLFWGHILKSFSAGGSHLGQHKNGKDLCYHRLNLQESP